MPNSYSRRNRSNNSTLALLSKPPLAPAPQVEGRLVTPGEVGQHSPAHGGHHSIAKPPVADLVLDGPDALGGLDSYITLLNPCGSHSPPLAALIARVSETDVLLTTGRRLAHLYNTPPLGAGILYFPKHLERM